MNFEKQFKLAIKNTKILKKPKHRLSTFGQSRINYFFLAEVAGFKDRSRLREGLVIAEKPKIITPDFLKNRFEGFGPETEELGKRFTELYGESFRALEYKFRNEGKSSQIEYAPTAELAERIVKNLMEMENEQSAVIAGLDQTWQISLTKFIVDECLASFESNLQDLEQHGFFETPEKIRKERKREIEALFRRARTDPALLSLLGQKLRAYDLFKEYEDRFLDLISLSSR